MESSVVGEGNYPFIEELVAGVQAELTNKGTMANRKGVGLVFILPLKRRRATPLSMSPSVARAALRGAKGLAELVLAKVGRLVREPERGHPSMDVLGIGGRLS
jgi:hypothetical protein